MTSRTETTTADILEDLFTRSATLVREVNAGTDLTADQFASATSAVFVRLLDGVTAEFKSAGRADLAGRLWAQASADAAAFPANWWSDVLTDAERGAAAADAGPPAGEHADRADALRRALADALEGMQEMLPYCPPYFQDKWQLPAYIDRARAVLRDDAAHTLVT